MRTFELFDNGEIQTLTEEQLKQGLLSKTLKVGGYIRNVGDADWKPMNEVISLIAVENKESTPSKPKEEKQTVTVTQSVRDEWAYSTAVNLQSIKVGIGTVSKGIFDLWLLSMICPLVIIIICGIVGVIHTEVAVGLGALFLFLLIIVGFAVVVNILNQMYEACRNMKTPIPSEQVKFK